MRPSVLYMNIALTSLAWADSDCPQDPSKGTWSTVDCKKIQLPYAGNSLLPPDPGPFSPPTPLPSAPKTSNPELTKEYYGTIASIFKDKASADCQECTSSFQTLHEAAHKISPSDITTLLSELCSAGYSLFQKDGEACTGPDSTYGGSASDGPYLAKLFYLLDESTQDINALCTYNSEVNCPAPPVAKIKESEWFKSKKPVHNDTDKAGTNTFGVVHMSDIHLDARYQITSDISRWGVIGTDAPGDLILSAFSTMSGLIDMDKIAFTLFTGDIVSHDNDVSVSEEYVMFEEQNVFDTFKAEMKNTKGDIPVYAALGNHDSYPEMYANGDSSWNYDFLSSLWQKNDWINATAAQDVKTHFGAYAVSNPSGMPGLKIISINTDFWYVDNVFNYANYSNPDPTGMLRFLISELEDSETANQRVWIVGHVPSGYASGSALPNPTALFQSIVVRFSPSTIAAIFWGHTHEEQRQVFYDFTEDSLENGLRDTSKVDLSKPLNMAWIGPSLTPQASPHGVNPAWSYYEVDQKTYSIMDAQTFYSDISKPNSSWTVAPFKLEYDTREAYDSKKTWPADQPLDAEFWDRYLAQAIETDRSVAATYNQYETRITPVTEPCTTTACLKFKKCNIQAGTAEAAALCKQNDSNGKTDPV